MLNTPEVHTLFSHPLASFLSTSAPFTAATASSSSGSTSSADVKEEASDTQLEQAAFELSYYTYHDLRWPPGPGGWTRGMARSRSRDDGGGSKSRHSDGNENAVKARTAKGEGKESRSDENKELYVRMHKFLTGREQGGVKPVYGLTSYALSSSTFLTYHV